MKKCELNRWLTTEYNHMHQIGFNEEKRDLCCADLRRGVIKAVDVAREFVKNNKKVSGSDVLRCLELWCGNETSKRD